MYGDEHLGGVHPPREVRLEHALRLRACLGTDRAADLTINGVGREGRQERGGEGEGGEEGWGARALGVAERRSGVMPPPPRDLRLGLGFGVRGLGFGVWGVEFEV